MEGKREGRKEEDTSYNMGILVRVGVAPIQVRNCRSLACVLEAGAISTDNRGETSWEVESLASLRLVGLAFRMLLRVRRVNSTTLVYPIPTATSSARMRVGRLFAARPLPPRRS